MQEDSLTYHLVSQKPEIFSWGFGIFLICFIIYSYAIGKKTFVLRELFYVKKDKSIFSEATTDEWGSRLLLCFQTCLLLAVFAYKYFSNHSDALMDSPTGTMVFILTLTALLCIFLILKWVMYYIVGLVFFDKVSLKIWMENFFSLRAFLGLFLFIPTLLYFYLETPCNFFFFFVLVSLGLFEILIIYKAIVLFFHKQGLLLHLFLYLCALEIIPLFFLWKIMVFVFNKFVENSTLWL